MVIVNKLNWNSESLKEEYMAYIEDIYNAPYPILTLNDMQTVLVSEGIVFSIVSVEK